MNPTEYFVYLRIIGRRLALFGLGALMLASGAAQAALTDRGGGLIYDDALNITWLQDANYSGSTNWSWYGANDWASGLMYRSFEDWRLPTLDEITYMYTDNLGGGLGTDKTGDQVSGSVTLHNIQWRYATSSSFDSTHGWSFSFSDGGQSRDSAKNTQGFGAWAVGQGDVGVVPIPAAIWLFASALGICGHRLRKSTG